MLFLKSFKHHLLSLLYTFNFKNINIGGKNSIKLKAIVEYKPPCLKAKIPTPVDNNPLTPNKMKTIP